MSEDRSYELFIEIRGGAVCNLDITATFLVIVTMHTLMMMMMLVMVMLLVMKCVRVGKVGWIQR